MAQGRALSILVLVDTAEALAADHDYTYDLTTEEWKNEAHVLKCLVALGHKPRLLALHDDIAPLLDEVRRDRPDLVFNLCEGFRGDRRFEANLPALLELMGLPYTGAGPEALALCKDKGLAKKILSYHDVRVPRFQVSHLARPEKVLVADFPYPALVKPLGLEASEGVAEASLVDGADEALKRAAFIHERYSCDAIIEEFIQGREIYVGIAGNDRVQVFRPRELFFDEADDGGMRMATYRAKWDDRYREKWGIRTGFAKLTAAQDEELATLSKKIYRLLRLKGYARLDYRLAADGSFIFLEANPNPTIARDEDFAASAVGTGMGYGALIQKIVKLSVS
jgi:D-alanine-D-alanine ligase